MDKVYHGKGGTHRSRAISILGGFVHRAHGSSPVSSILSALSRARRRAFGWVSILL